MSNPKRSRFVALVYISQQIDALKEYLNTKSNKDSDQVILNGLWILSIEEDLLEGMLHQYYNLDIKSEECLYLLMKIQKKILKIVLKTPPTLKDLKGGKKSISFFKERFKKLSLLIQA